MKIFKSLLILLFFATFIFNVNQFVYANVCIYQKLGQINLYNIDGFLIGDTGLNDKYYRMIIDTGSEGSLISQQAVQELALPIDNHHVTILTGSKGGKKSVRNAILYQLKLGQLIIHSLSLPIGKLPSYPNLTPPVVGLIVGDILSHFDLEFDLLHHQLMFWHIKTESFVCQAPPLWLGKEQIHLDIENNRAFITLVLDHQKIKALIDTGARSKIISLKKVLQMGVSLSDLQRDSGGMASSLNDKETRYYWHQFKIIKIGNKSYHHPILTVSKLKDTSEMLLGSDWLNNKHIWFSYKRKTLYIEP